nr:MAG TPA: hypothetical protein [Caudoviricetes sp.]
MLNNFFQIFEFFHFFINVTEYHFPSPFLYQPLAEQQSAVAINLYIRSFKLRQKSLICLTART